MSSYLRVKRKRNEDPIATFAVDGTACERLRKRRNIADAMENFSMSSSSKSKDEGKVRRMVYKRVRTIDIDDRKKKRRKKAENEVSLLEEKGFVRKSVPVLAPDEIQMDKAIWTAFRTGSFEEIFRLISHGTGSLNFQRRASDNTTALMAAAHQGNLDITKQLLEMGADVNLKSAHGDTASDIARSRGHDSVVKCIESFEKKKKDEDSDFVYDIYRVCDVDFDEAAIVKTSSTSNERYRGIVCGRDVEEFDDADWEFKIFNEAEHDECDDDFVDEYDSNAEDHVGNDYPDEEEEEDEYDGGSSSGYDRESHDDEDYNDWC